MRIGAAAARLGIEPHVLRHWEDVGLLSPRRLPSGHRDYDQDTIDRARLIRVAQGVGSSLREIGAFAAADRAGRRAAIAGHRARLRRRVDLLQAVDAFLAHIGDCVHPVLSECPECSAFLTRCDDRAEAVGADGYRGSVRRGGDEPVGTRSAGPHPSGATPGSTEVGKRGALRTAARSACESTQC